MEAFAAAIAIDDGEDVAGVYTHLGALVVAGGGANAADGIAYDGHAGDVQGAAADAFEGFALTAYAEASSISR